MAGQPRSPWHLLPFLAFVLLVYLVVKSVDAMTGGIVSVLLLIGLLVLFLPRL